MLNHQFFTIIAENNLTIKQLIMKSILHYIFIFSITLSSVSVIAQTPSFEGLGYIHESLYPMSKANGVSYDGSVVVGVSSSIYQGNEVMEAYKWTQEDGLIGIGGLTDNGFFSYARAVSSDGLTIIGYSNSESPALNWEAFRWTENEGMIGLGDLVSENYSSESTDVSSDGLTVVGRSYTTAEPFKWVNGVIETFLDDDIIGEAWGISGDGNVIVGSAGIDGVPQAFRWSEDSGVVGLGFEDPVGMGGGSLAWGVSSDGSVVVGYQHYSLPYPPYSVVEAFRWTEEAGRVSLGHLSDDVMNSEAFDVSDDGSIIVGASHAGSGIGFKPFIWTQSTGMLDIEEFLASELGLDLEGWTLSTVEAISGDGTTLVGSGINPDGNPESWRAVIASALSVENFNLSIEIKAYPNPVENALNINSNSSLEYISIYNMLGQEVFTSNLLNKSSQIDVSNFKAGLYLVKVSNGTEKTTFRIIKK